jgi:hypothetical protein
LTSINEGGKPYSGLEACGRGKRNSAMNGTAGRCRYPSPAQRPAGWSTATAGWLWSRQGIRWRHNRGCAWYTSRSRCSSELIKAFRISRRRIFRKGRVVRFAIHPASSGPKSGPVTKTFKSVGNKNPGAHQAHHCSHCLNHRKSPFAPLHPPNDRAVAQSKRFRGTNRDRTGVMICCNTLSETGTKAVQSRCILPATAPVFRRMRTQPFIHHAGAHPISAAFRMRYLYNLMRRWAAS